MSLKQWAAIFVWWTIYWSVAGREIARASEVPHLEHSTWWLPEVLTMPWSGIAEAISGGETGRPSRWLNGAVTATGALLIGLLFALAVWRVGRRGRRLPDGATDYDDGPAGALADGRFDPPKG